MTPQTTTKVRFDDAQHSYQTTIPRALAQSAFEPGDPLAWDIASANALEVFRGDDETVTTTNVHQNSNGQWQVRVPKAIGDAMGLDGQRVSWRVVGAERLRLEVT